MRTHDAQIAEVIECPFCHEKETGKLWIINPKHTKEHGDFVIMFNCGETIHLTFMKTSQMIAKYKIDV